jgi:PBP/GOBP family
MSPFQCQLNREYKARRAARQCVVEQKVSYDVALKFSKGDLTDNSDSAKCFVKCFAYKIGFINPKGEFQRDEFLKYVEFVVPKHIEVS